MAQVKKLQGGSTVEPLKKYKIRLDDQDIEVTKEELDQIKASAFEKIKGTESMGPGDEHAWNDRYVTWKNMVENGTFNVDTDPKETIQISYQDGDGSKVSNTDLGLGRKGKVRQNTQLGKLFGGIDAPDKQTSMINYYMGVGLRDFNNQRNEAQQKAEADTIAKSKADADTWAGQFNDKFGIGYSTFNKQYSLANAPALLKPYWDMPNDESRLNFVFQGIEKNLAPIFALKPETDALKIEALKRKGMDVLQLQESYKDYVNADTRKQKITALKDLWQYSNLAQSSTDDMPFWDKQAYDKLVTGTTPPAAPVTPPTDLTDDDLSELEKAINDTKIKFPWEMTNPFGGEIPNEYYQLRSFGFKNNGQDVSYEDLIKGIGTAPDSEEKTNLTGNLENYKNKLNEAYGQHTSGWLTYQPDEGAIANNALVRKIMPNVGNQPYNVRMIGKQGKYVLIQTLNPTNAEKDIFGNVIPTTTVIDLSTNDAIASQNLRWDPIKKKYEIRVGTEVIEFDKIEANDSQKLEALLTNLGAHKQPDSRNKQQYDSKEYLPSYKKDEIIGANLFQEGGIIMAQQGNVLTLNYNDQNDVNKFAQHYRTKYPNITDDQISDILNRGINSGKIVMPTIKNKPWTISESAPDLNVGGNSQIGSGPVNLQNLFDEGQLSETDKLDIATLGFDLVSLIPGPVGSAAGLASAGTGLASNIKRDGMQQSDFGWAAVDTGLAALSFLPVVGGMARMGKIVSNVNRLKVPLGIIHGALLAAGSINLQRTVEKMISGDLDQLNVEDVRNLAGVLSGLKFSRKMNENLGQFGHGKFGEGKGMLSVKINTPDGKAVTHRVILNRGQLEDISKAEDQALRAKQLIMERLPKDAELQARVGDFSKITIDDIDVPMKSNYSIMKPWKNTASKGLNDQLDIQTSGNMTRPMPDDRTGFQRISDILFGNRVSGSNRVLNDPDIRSVATPVTGANNRPRLELKDGKLVDAEKFEEVKGTNRGHLKDKLQNNKKGIEHLKRFNEVQDIDAQLTRNATEVNGGAKKKALLAKLQNIDRQMDNASVIAKDASMRQDITTARTKIKQIIQKHNANLGLKQLPENATKKATTPSDGPNVTNPTTLFINTPKLPPLEQILNPAKNRFPGLNNKQSTTPQAKETKIKKTYPKKDKPAPKPVANKKKQSSGPKKSDPAQLKLFGRDEQMKGNQRKGNNDKFKSSRPKDKPTVSKKRPYKREDGGLLIPIFQQEGILTRNPWLTQPINLPFPDPMFKFKIANPRFPKLNYNNGKKTEQERWGIKPWMKNLDAPEELMGPTTFSYPGTSGGLQSGITPKIWERFKLDPVWTLKAASTLNKVRNLRAQDTRYDPALQVALKLPQSTVSGSMQLEGKYNEQADLARTAQSQPITSDQKLNTANRANTEANLRTFLSEGATKVQGLQDQLRQRQVSEQAANISNQQATTNANLAELAKAKNQVRTNENFISRNVAELQSNYTDDYADHLQSDQVEKKQLKRQLGLSTIQKAMDTKYANEFAEFERLSNMRMNGALTDPKDIDSYKKLNTLMQEIRSKVYNMSYQYMIDDKLPDFNNGEK